MKRPVTGIFGLAAATMRGFSLVELMVAMAISLLLLSGVVAIFASSRTSYETTDKLSRIQENGRFALEQFTHDIRESGFVGCSRFPPVVSSSLDPSKFLYDFVSVNGFKPVRGFQFVSGTNWSPTLPADAGLPTSIIPGSDILALRLPARGVAPQKLQKDALGTDDLLFPNVTGTFKDNDTVMLYSCGAQAFFQATSFGGGTMKHEQKGLNATNDLRFDFPAAFSQAVPINTVLYYIAAKSDTDLTPSLWRKIGEQDPEEMVEGVEQMQIDYGLDTNNDYVVDAYQTADAVTNWDQVFSVRVALLVRSMEKYGFDKDTSKHYLLTGDHEVAVPAPNDGYYREVFTSTVVIRNKAVTQ
jgi:type IV pilus assembly protein PilW